MLEELQAIHAQLQEENKNLKEYVQMFDKRMVEMEKRIESLKRLLPFLMKKFLEHWYSLTAIIVDWDKSRVYLVHLGENVI